MHDEIVTEVNRLFADATPGLVDHEASPVMTAATVNTAESIYATPVQVVT